MPTDKHHRAAIMSPLLLTIVLAAASLSLVHAETANPTPPAVDAVGGVDTGDCRTLAAGIEEQSRKLSQELRQIKREIAALNQNLERPGVREVMAGIGYILGLFGVAALVASRRDKASRSN